MKLRVRKVPNTELWAASRGPLTRYGSNPAWAVGALEYAESVSSIERMRRDGAAMIAATYGAPAQELAA
jgi:hypothetical protein